MRKILLLAIFLLLILTGCVEEYKYNYAIISVGGESREIELKSWTTTGIEYNTYWLIDTEGNRYLVNDKNCVLVQKVEVNE